MIDTSTIVINTVPEDSVITSGLTKNPLGYFVDPIFGTSISSIATDLNLPAESEYTPPVGTVLIDSARLVLTYAPGFYGDSIISKYTVDVYQLQKALSLASAYTSKSNFGNYSSSPLLGSLTFNARPNDSVKIYDIITGAPDTLVSVPPQIRVPISPSFINSYLFGANSTILGANAVFQSTIKGLFITIDRSKSTGAGGMLMFTNTDSLQVYYRSVSGKTIDTGEVTLPVANTALQIQHNYTATIQNELNNAKTGSRNTFYLQGLVGLRAKISFPNLLVNLKKSLINRPGKPDSLVLINRAELVITPAPGSYIPFNPIPKITMYQLDLALQRIELQDAGSDPRSGGESVFGGYYAPNTNPSIPAPSEYHFIITAYLQDLLMGTTVDYGTYIGPIDNTNTSGVDIAATPLVVSRTVAVGSDLTSSLSQYRIKLNIIYTKIPKI
jgi:hypothetical protein